MGHMKKVFEFLLILIIFYGVYAAFDGVAPLFWDEPELIHVMLAAFITSALLIVLYRFMVKTEVSRDLKQHIEKLHTDLKHKDTIIKSKDTEIQKAQTFKEDLIAEAEASSAIEEE